VLVLLEIKSEALLSTEQKSLLSLDYRSCCRSWVLIQVLLMLLTLLKFWFFVGILD